MSSMRKSNDLVAVGARRAGGHVRLREAQAEASADA